VAQRQTTKLPPPFHRRGRKRKEKEALVDSIVAILHCQFKEQTQVQLNCVRGISFEPMSF
jgi:hypothetical protein